MSRALMDRLADRIYAGRRAGVHQELISLTAPVGRRADLAGGSNLIDPIGGTAGILAVIIGESAAANRVSALLRDEGVHAAGLGYPVVPEGTARLGFQLSASHPQDDLVPAVSALARARAAFATFAAAWNAMGG